MKMMALAALGLMALAGCSGGNREPEVLNEGVEDANVTMVEENVATPPPAENIVEAPTPEVPPHVTEDQQMRDDADASGLTARLPDEGAEPGQSGNEVRPVE